MSSNTQPTGKLESKPVAERMTKKQYAEPQLNYLGKITEVTAGGSAEKPENVPPPDRAPQSRKKRA